MNREEYVTHLVTNIGYTQEQADAEYIMILDEMNEQV